jgi:IS5 family transposase
VIVDTTVQPKAVAFRTDAKLMHRARERLVRLAKRSVLRAGGQAGVDGPSTLRQRQAVQAGQSGTAQVCAYLGRVFRDILRKTRDEASLRQMPKQ